jgi:hypothetical protein
MTKGTDPTPIQLTPRYSLRGDQNAHRLQLQLRQAGASLETLIKFHEEVDRIRQTPGIQGQIQPITEAARAIGAEVHWID